MFKRKSKMNTLKEKLSEAEDKLRKNKIIYDFNSKKIEDDFNVLNQIIDLKVSHYENIVFIFNRYREEKKVNVLTNEVEKTTSDIIYESFKSLSEEYMEYLITKYFASKEAMIDVYTQKVYLLLFAFANNYNIGQTKNNFN